MRCSEGGSSVSSVVGTISATLSENFTFFFGRESREVEERIDVVLERLLS